MKNQKFRIEMELIGIVVYQAARYITDFLNGSSYRDDDDSRTFMIKDSKDKQWVVLPAKAIQPLGSLPLGIHDRRHPFKIVSPMLQYEDIETLQEMVRTLREKNAQVNEFTRLRIQIDAKPFDVNSLCKLVTMLKQKEDLFYQALQVPESRIRSDCQKINVDFLEQINLQKPKTMEEFKELWKQNCSELGVSENGIKHRYALNLDSVFHIGTIDFLHFKSTLHAGKIKSYLQLCLAISHQALTGEQNNLLQSQDANNRETLERWLSEMGLVGREYKSVRFHMLAHYDGTVRWESPLKVKKQLEQIEQRNSREQNINDILEEPEDIYEEESVEEEDLEEALESETTEEEDLEEDLEEVLESETTEEEIPEISL